VDNFLAFKRLMVKRNKEMNQQALAMEISGNQGVPKGEALKVA
jgi:hypothetical protein